METKFYETLHEVKSHNRVTYNSDEHDGSKESLILSLWICAKKRPQNRPQKVKNTKMPRFVLFAGKCTERTQ